MRKVTVFFLILLTIWCGGSLTIVAAKNVALSENGAVITAKNYGTYDGNEAVASKAIDGDTSTGWGGTWSSNDVNWLKVEQTNFTRSIR